MSEKIAGQKKAVKKTMMMAMGGASVLSFGDSFIAGGGNGTLGFDHVEANGFGDCCKPIIKADEDFAARPLFA
jgi:hypothetical protein